MEVSQNYFELLGQPVGFDVDLSSLKSNYQALQKAVHPDRFANASDQERVLSVRQAALINDAFDTLKKPIGRAKYLLQLSGVEYNDENNTVMDPSFLMHQMELREGIASIKSAKDPFQVAEDLISEIESHIKDLLKALSRSFAQDVANHSDEIISNIRKLQFFEKLRIEVENVESELDD